MMSAYAKVSFGIDFAYNFLDAYMPIGNYGKMFLSTEDVSQLGEKSLARSIILQVGYTKC